MALNLKLKQGDGLSKSLQGDSKNDGDALIWTAPSQQDCRRELRGALHPRYASRKFDDA